jgi:hypothetical protein
LGKDLEQVYRGNLDPVLGRSQLPYLVQGPHSQNSPILQGP